MREVYETMSCKRKRQSNAKWRIGRHLSTQTSIIDPRGFPLQLRYNVCARDCKGNLRIGVQFRIDIFYYSTIKRYLDAYRNDGIIVYVISQIFLRFTTRRRVLMTVEATSILQTSRLLFRFESCIHSAHSALVCKYRNIHRISAIRL